MNQRISKQPVSSQPGGKHKQSGFSLIEALVAFLIISIGMLGVASLQTMSMKAGHTAAIRAEAVMKADQILESMRGNPTALLSYGGAGADNGCSQTAVAAAVCTPTQLALDDTFRWQQSLPNNLSAGVAITPPVAPETITNIVVTISWSERNVDDGGATNMEYQVTAQM